MREQEALKCEINVPRYPGNACQAFTSFSPLFTQPGRDRERVRQRQGKIERNRKGGDRKRQRVKRTLVNLNEKSLTELLPLLDLS